MRTSRGDSYGSCSSLRLRRRVGVGVPALVGLPGSVLVAASPQSPAIPVRLVAAGLWDHGSAELPQQLRNGDGDQAGFAGVCVAGALAGGCDGEEGVGEQGDRGPAVPGGPGGDLAAVEPGGLLRELVILLDSPPRDRYRDEPGQRDRVRGPAQEVADGPGVTGPAQEQDGVPVIWPVGGDDGHAVLLLRRHRYT